MTTARLSTFIDLCETELDLYRRLTVNKLTDPNETFYKSLPLCIIDAVFSIGVKYQSVEKAERSFIEYFGLDISRTYPIINEYTVKDFIRDMESFPTFDDAAVKGFKNRQRTSSTNGILKAEACYRVAMVFLNHGINTLGDFAAYENKSLLDADILSVKGQGSGIMLKYLYMLAGDKNEVKPDRHMVNFMKRVYPKLTMSTANHPMIKDIITESVSALKKKYPELTARFLDVLIWDYMR